MGQKSRHKKQKPQNALKQTQSKVEAAPSLVTSSAAAGGPSLVQSSTSFKAKVVSEELLQVRRGDIRLIGILFSVMIVLFIILGVVNNHSSVLQKVGTHLASSMGI